jgi:signal transduction histidine kinase
MSSLIDEIINNVRRISSELRPNILDYIGLLPSLEWLLEDFKKKTETDVSFVSDIKEIKVDKSTSTSIFRIFQEAITNIIRHANATFVQMNIEEDNKNYVVQLLDNGVGVAEEKINNLKSLGVIGMKERALQINSLLDISNRAEGGTKVSLIIPKGNGLW